MSLKSNKSFFGEIVERENEGIDEIDSDFEEDLVEFKKIEHPLYGESKFKSHTFYGSQILESDVCFGQDWELEGEEILKTIENIGLIQEDSLDPELFTMIGGTLYITNYQLFFKKKLFTEKFEEISLLEKMKKRNFSIPISKIFLIEEKTTRELNNPNYNGFKIISKV
jgi:hypothetical protein